MPDLLTPQALASAGPLVIETLLKHFISHASIKKKSEARGEDLMYDEAFVLMKTFLEMATKYPVSALQRFGLVRTPAPPWVALHRVVIPHKSLTDSAKYLITALGGSDMAYKVAGGSKWWQVRAGSGVEAEWIVMKKDWREYTKAQANAKEARGGEQKTDADGMVGDDGGVGENGEFRKEMDELRCMLYIHGGAYYWGSINTHRYTIWRYARKMHGRCFAVNYRKAPQYPFPCAIQDCLAAYLYLVDPPPGSKHRPVQPKNIVIAGDSAGGGLVLALLQILRDTDGLELPAGGVLISPWSDLTHSFPSILQNTATDIVPPYSFIHVSLRKVVTDEEKPSSLWPPPPPVITDEIQSRLRTRVKEAVAHLREGRHQFEPSTLPAPSFMSKANSTHLINKQTEFPSKIVKSSDPDDGIPSAQRSHSDLHPLTEQSDENSHPDPQTEPRRDPPKANPAELWKECISERPIGDTRPATLAQCDSPLSLEIQGQEVELDTQIQLYATNGQLNHPWVSPVLGYLGGLPPLYINCGNNEVLRDEIIYLAHKAANPGNHPIRDDVKRLLPSLEGIEERFGPTDVHLQVYDGTCHDLPLFSMTKPARGLFRAVASFVRYCTPSAPGSLSVSSDWSSRRGTPAPSQPGSGTNTPRRSAQAKPASLDLNTNVLRPSDAAQTASPQIYATPVGSSTDVPNLSELQIDEQGEDGVIRPAKPVIAIPPSPRSSTPDLSVESGKTHTSRVTFETSSSSTSSRDAEAPTPTGADASAARKLFERHAPLRQLDHENRQPTGDDAGPRFEDVEFKEVRAKRGEAGWPGIYAGDHPFKDHMIRERVSVEGACRPLESPDELAALTMPAGEIGMIKEGPAMRYLNGQSLWDKKYAHTRRKVARKRQKNLNEARKTDSKKVLKLWQEKVAEHRAEKEREKAEKAEQKKQHLTVAEGLRRSSAASDGGETGSETEGESSSDDEEQGHEEGRMMDQSWSWNWALEGEAPPPSAIVSRRDFGEARHLALMADRMDDRTSSSVHGLSIWVGLASFFSNSSERNSAQEAVKQAKAAHKAQKEATKAAQRDGEGDDGSGAGKDGPLKKMGRVFGLVKKQSEEAKAD